MEQAIGAEVTNPFTWPFWVRGQKYISAPEACEKTNLFDGPWSNCTPRLPHSHNEKTHADLSRGSFWKHPDLETVGKGCAGVEDRTQKSQIPQ